MLLLDCIRYACVIACYRSIATTKKVQTHGHGNIYRETANHNSLKFIFLVSRDKHLTCFGNQVNSDFRLEHVPLQLPR